MNPYESVITKALLMMQWLLSGFKCKQAKATNTYEHCSMAMQIQTFLQGTVRFFGARENFI